MQATTIGVLVDVGVDVTVGVPVSVGVGVTVGVWVTVGGKGVSVGVPVSVGVGVGVPVDVGVGVVKEPYSYAPTSQPPPAGRVRLRWSAKRAAPALQGGGAVLVLMIWQLAAK